MPRYDDALFAATAPPDRRLPRVVASSGASAALCKLRHDRGPLVIVLGASCAAISIAKVLSRRDFDRREHHVALGTVAHCPVYADIRHFEPCPHDTLVVDLHSIPNRNAPLFITRPESRAERQQRVFAECAAPAD